MRENKRLRLVGGESRSPEKPDPAVSARKPPGNAQNIKIKKKRIFL